MGILKRVAYLAATFSVAGLSVAEGFAAGGGVSEPFAPPFFQVHLAPPKRFVPTVLSFAQKVFPDQQVHALPMLILGLWGYPEFVGLSDSDPVGLFFIPAGSKAGPFFTVACAKMADDAPMRTALALQKFATKTFTGWTFISSGNEVLRAIESSGYGDDLAELAGSALENDFVVELGSGMVGQFVDECEQALVDGLAASGDISKHMPAFSLFAIAKDFANQIEKISIGGDFFGEVFSGHVRIKPLVGSDLSVLFREPTNPIDISSVAAAIGDSGLISFVWRYDQQKLCRLIELAIDGLFSGGPSGLEGVSERELSTFIERMFSRCTGATAGQLSLDGDGNLVVGEIVAADINGDELAAWVDFSFSTVVHAMVERCGLAKNLNRACFVDVNRNAFVHCGLPVIAVSISVEDAPLGQDSPESQEQDRREIAGELYFCALDGAVAAANSEEAIVALIDAFLAGGHDGRSLADEIHFASGDMAGFRADIQGLLCGTVERSSAAAKHGLTVSIGLDAGDLTVNFSIGASDIAAIVAAFAEGQ
ncbi:MAG: hypothetical protein LBB38_02545 [Puniceicoccales bacterium]|jgi:hypothetical protein|nr:hypothetical protein [Puniceicoccales bacterium]